MALAIGSSQRGTEKIYFALLLVCVFWITFEFLSRGGHHAGTALFGTDLEHSNKSSSRQHTGDALDLLEDVDLLDKDDESLPSLPAWFPPGVEGVDTSRMHIVDPYIKAIMDPKDRTFSRLRCPVWSKQRYMSLRARRNLDSREHAPPKQYFFALNLYQCANILPRLLASVVEAMRFLRPEDCVLSIVGGRSDDGTTEILTKLRKEMEAMKVTYYFSTSNVDPLQQGHDRIMELAKLRNLVMDPLVQQPHLYADDATVIFLNDVALCPDDILELVYQKWYQQAHMTCAMDWGGQGTAFYDSWISRTMDGDLFIEVPQSGSFEFSQNLFWNDPKTRARYEARLPFQVYSCWNGGAAFTAKPIFKNNITFRASYKDECYMGEPTLFCKDYWLNGYGRIAVIPSVNVAYTDEEATFVKLKHGYVTSVAHKEEQLGITTKIKWKPDPPALVKCQPDWQNPSWVEWAEAKDQKPYDWSHSGYFNADKPGENGLRFEDS